jgi:hypothetical protein
MKIGLLKPRQGAITCCYTNIAFVPWQHYLPRFYGYVLSPQVKRLSGHPFETLRRYNTQALPYGS